MRFAVIDSLPSLSRRERQIMDVLHRRGRASATEVGAELDGAPANATVRTLLRILVDKGHARFDRDGKTYLYAPIADRERAGAMMMGHVVRTFFAGSAADAMASLLGRNRDDVTAEQLDRLEQLIADARERDR